MNQSKTTLYVEISTQKPSKYDAIPATVVAKYSTKFFSHTMLYRLMIMITLQRIIRTAIRNTQKFWTSFALVVFGVKS